MTHTEMQKALGRLKIRRDNLDLSKEAESKDLLYHLNVLIDETEKVFEKRPEIGEVLLNNTRRMFSHIERKLAAKKER